VNIQVTASSGALGAEVSGVDLSAPLPAATLAAIERAWYEHIVLVFREQQLSDAQLIAFGRHFGELHRVVYQDRERPPGVPEEIELISNIVVDGKPIGLLGAGEATWHTDMSMFDVPASATMLFAEEVPSRGGNTRFCNLYLALERLDPQSRARIEGRRSIHDLAYMANGSVRAGYEQVADKSQGPGARHPIIRTHPKTGRQALYLGRQGYGYILGLPVAESDALIDALWAHMTRPEFVWEHRWRKGDVVMWDNRCTAHSRSGFAPEERRLLRRVTVKGERPV